MSLFEKKKPEEGTFSLPTSVLIAISFLLMGLYFLLCFNQDHYASYGDADSLRFTLSFFVLLLLGTALEIGFYFALPKGKKYAMYLSLLPKLVLGASIIALSVSYFEHFNETVTGLRVLRYVVLILAIVLFLLDVLSWLNEGPLKGKIIRNPSQNPLLFNETTLYLSGICTLLMAYSAIATSGLKITHFASIALLICLAFLLISFLLNSYFSVDKKRGESFKRFRMPLSYVWIALGVLLAIVYGISFVLRVAEEGGMSYRAFMWGFFGGLTLAVLGLLYFFSLYLETKGERFKKLLKESLED